MGDGILSPDGHHRADVADASAVAVVGFFCGSGDRMVFDLSSDSDLDFLAKVAGALLAGRLPL